MSILDNLKAWILEPEEKEDSNTDSRSKEGNDLDFQKEENFENLDSIILIAKPKTFKDALALCKQIKMGRAVMLSLENTVSEDKQRLVDFVSGVVMAQDGMIAKVYNNVYVCASNNIGIIDLNKIKKS